MAATRPVQAVMARRLLLLALAALPLAASSAARLPNFGKPRQERTAIAEPALAHGAADASSVQLVARRRRPPPYKFQRAVGSFLEADASRHLLAGAVAGAISNTVVAPLDIVRIIMMNTKERISVAAVCSGLYAEGGVLAFWRGNTADVLRTMPASALRFFTFATSKRVLPLAVGSAAAVSLLAGGIAGMVPMAACYPLETLRTRMSVAGSLGGQGVIGYGRSLVRAEGAGALYRGLGASLISVAPYTAVRFGAYDILNRSAAFEWLPGVARVAGCGMVAGLCASAATFPFEVARRRAMTGVGAANPFTSMVQIYKTEGVRYGLYKGYGVNVVKVVPSTAITFTVYEKMRTALDRLASAWSPTKLRPQTPSEQDETLEEVISPTLPGSSAAFAAARRRRLRRPA